MYNEEKIISTLALIQDTCLTDLNDLEIILVISNLLLIEAEKYLPKELEQDAKNILSNGKRINFESLKLPENVGLNLATKAHLMVSEIQEFFDNGES